MATMLESTAQGLGLTLTSDQLERLQTYRDHLDASSREFILTSLPPKAPRRSAKSTPPQTPSQPSAAA